MSRLLLFGISQLNLNYSTISKNNFVGTLPEDLLHVKSIEHMNFGNNYFTGSLPNSDGKLLNLIRFNTYDNKLSAIPNWIECAMKLEYLNLNSNLSHETIPAFV